jgi:Cu+-exporting ATPase
LVEDASSSKAPISRLADKISAVFVPVVIGISLISIAVWLLLGYPFDFALSIGIAVLVISCPCALGLATPVAIMVGTGKGAEYGILIKSAESLEMAHKIDTIVLDKTGTITEGKPKVTDLYTIKPISENQLLQIACSLEKPSEHSLSEAILLEAEKRKIKIKAVENFQAIPGQGIEAKLDGINYIAGNQKLMTDRKVNFHDMASLSDKLANEGKTPLFIANDKEILGIIAVADGVLPQDKDKVISSLQAKGKIVAMIGDGINDAPAMMRSNLGIAIGAGTDIAIESADVVLMKSDLLDAVTTLRLSKAVMLNIKQNLFWAFFYNIIGIPLAAGVFYGVLGWKLNPMFAAAAMSLSSVTVVMNALRLLTFKPLVSISSNKNQINKNNYQSINTTKIMLEKTLQIKGMSCAHCSARVEKVLNAIDGVEAKVDLESNSAIVKLSHEVSDETIKSAVDAIGYEVVGVA